jgi:proteasome lid subunit RPN8/RPN11
MISTLLLPLPLRAQLAREARAAFPRECCGLIEGARDGDDARVTALHPTRNLAEESDRFEIDPAEHIRLLRALRGSGRGIVGCYHSHPNGRPEMSPRDRQSVSDDDRIWLVAAIAADDVMFAAFACPKGGANAISSIPLAPIV